MNDELITAVADVLCVGDETLTDESARGLISEWDSLAHLQIIAEVEARFNVRIPFEEVASIGCIGDFRKYLPK